MKTHNKIDSIVAENAATFWQRVGRVEPFPRSLESSVLWSLPLGIVKLPRLGLDVVRTWLKERHISVDFGVPDRPLRGCLVARRGEGLIFLDGGESDEERRLSVAHEVAHFLRDYLLPRDHALQSFGPAILDVLDGYRAPSPTERLAGILRGVHVGTYTHLLSRDDRGFATALDVVQAEDLADRLALELLAPLSDVTERMENLGIRWQDSEAGLKVADELVETFGLPAVAARRYADHIVGRNQGVSSFRDWLMG